MTQLLLDPILDESERDTCATLHRYIARHVTTYRHYAVDLEPNRARWTDVWDRLAFAILTANTEVSNAVTAFKYAQRYRGHVDLRGFRGIVPERATYVNALPLGRDLLRVALRRRGEFWSEYRLRLAHEFDGLAITKASYAASLLYPLTCRVACLDTWMQKLFTGARHFESLSANEYREIEKRLYREYSRPHRINLSLAQWMIWDCLRGTVEPQRFFVDEILCQA